MLNNPYLIRSINEWEQFIKSSKDLTNKVIEGIDFTKEIHFWEDFIIENTTFLACKFKREDASLLIETGAFLYPKFKHLPYNPYRQNLYTYYELLEGYSFKKDNSYDYKIYKHFIKNKYNPAVLEALSQRIHDHNIDVSLRDLLGYDEFGMTEKKAVGFMGGHSTKRGTKYYNKVAETAKLTSEAGYYVVTGGGPGIMEAANLGAYFANQSTESLHRAIDILSDLNFENNKSQNDYKAINYIEQSRKVLELFPSEQESLAIPTWFYGHEPSNLFATHIAKYFSNSIREDTLLAISLYGVVYAPGSAGTTQEIFQEAAQNHYGTFGYYSPMIFLGKERYVEETSLYSVMHQLAKGKEYKSLLHLTDTPKRVVEFIQENPPIKVS